MPQEALRMTMKTSSTCFYPTQKGFAEEISTPSGNTSNEHGNTSSGRDSSSDLTPKEKYHAGRSKWGKYKKKERKEKRMNQSQLDCQASAPKVIFETTKEGFDFPDGGWVCSNCQNYNF